MLSAQSIQAAALLHGKHVAELGGCLFKMEDAEPVAGLFVVDFSQCRGPGKGLLRQSAVSFKNPPSAAAQISTRGLARIWRYTSLNSPTPKYSRFPDSMWKPMGRHEYDFSPYRVW